MQYSIPLAPAWEIFLFLVVITAVKYEQTSTYFSLLFHWLLKSWTLFQMYLWVVNICFWIPFISPTQLIIRMMLSETIVKYFPQAPQTKLNGQLSLFLLKLVGLIWPSVVFIHWLKWEIGSLLLSPLSPTSKTNKSVFYFHFISTHCSYNTSLVQTLSHPRLLKYFPYCPFGL